MNFNILIIGDNCVGKTSFIRKHVSGNFINIYNKTNKKEINSLAFITNQGEIKVNLYDGVSLKDMDTIIHGIIIMFDKTNKKSFTNLYTHLINISPQIPFVLCGNKVELGKKPNDSEIINLINILKIYNPNFKYYYDINVQSGYNYEKPIVSLLRTQFPNITF